ncbi:hypothetical protein HID58_033375 [Brassica napus]|uniref:Uncharacterized protein n=1 Tax=Brassica napus TaxID=3708 RepID=A0ABQ8BZ28_BRANA|nr:hypothetical protein HID58_033375 [Brassica napus]
MKEEQKKTTVKLIVLNRGGEATPELEQLQWKYARRRREKRCDSSLKLSDEPRISEAEGVAGEKEIVSRLGKRVGENGIESWRKYARRRREKRCDSSLKLSDEPRISEAEGVAGEKEIVSRLGKRVGENGIESWVKIALFLFN